MRILPREIVIDPNDPFKNDAIQKEEYAFQLMNLVTQVEEPLVLAINAPWGEGKTTFVKMWLALLEKNGFKTIYLARIIHKKGSELCKGLYYIVLSRHQTNL